MQIDFRRDLGEIAVVELQRLGYSANDQDPTKAARSLLTVRRRMPPRRTWVVEESRELRRRRRSLPVPIRRGLDTFVKAARRGNDLKPWLSKTIRDPSYQDDVLHSWAITHFHLGEEFDASGFISRTGELLFGIVDSAGGKIYLLDVVDHDSFSKQELLDIVEANWPELLDGHVLQGASVESNYSDDEVEAFRKLGVNVATKTAAGTVITDLGGGLSTAGTSMSTTRELNMIHRHLDQMESELHERAMELEDVLGTSPGSPGEGPQIKLVEYGPQVRIIAAETGTVLVDEPLDFE